METPDEKQMFAPFWNSSDRGILVASSTAYWLEQDFLRKDLCKAREGHLRATRFADPYCEK